MPGTQADYVVAGGGLCGCVVASRLKQAGFSVILIESGPGLAEISNPAVLAAAEAFTLAFTNPDLLYHYSTTSQEALNGRLVGVQGGHMLGGGSAVNYAAWTRGHRADYHKWARLVNDTRWSYDELLPYFKRSESYVGTIFPEQHGFHGPINVTSGPRGYPLEHQTRDALLQSGLEWNRDMNSGDPSGFARLIESWQNGTRSFAAKDYDLEGVEIISNSHVAKLVIDSGSAKGVELVSGNTILANKEIILSCGAARTPQVLMLSGIGPSSELRKHGIPLVADLPVGENLMDHGALHLTFRLKNPEKGYAVGSPGFDNPEFFKGAPIDFLSFASAPDGDLREAAEMDGFEFQPGPRCDYELSCSYAPGPPVPGIEPLPINGSFYGISLCCVSPSSRGRVTLQDTNPETNPNIDPAYFSTETDRAIMRASMRQAFKIAESPAGQTFIAGEEPPDSSFDALNTGSTDAELDARLRASSATFNHLAGTAAMGSVTDSHCRVKGVQNLRVIDASILPVPLSAHLQAPLYAIAESAASLLIHGK